MAFPRHKIFLVVFAIHILGFLFSPKLVFAQCEPIPELWLEQLSLIEKSQDDTKTKIDYCEALRKQYFKCTSKKDSVFAQIAHRLGSFYFKNNNLHQAIDYTREAILINSQKHPASSRPYLANSYFNLGVYYNYLNQYSISITYYDSAFQVASVYSKENLIMKALQQISYSYFQLGDYQKSIDVSIRGISFAERSDDRYFQAILLTQKAQSAIHLNKLYEAEDDLKKGLGILEPSNKQDLASINSVYALLHLKKNDYEKAKAYYEKSFQTNLSLEHFAQCARDLLDLGLLYDHNMKDSGNALKTYLAGIEIAQNIGEPYLLSALYTNIGVVHWRQKNFFSALQNYQRSLNHLPINFNDTLIKANPTKKQLLLVANHYYVFQLFSNKAHSQLELYKKEQKIEYLVQALETFELTDFMIDQMRQKQTKEVSKSFWRETTKEAYNFAIETCYLLNDAERAYYFFEKSRAVLLNDKLNTLNAKAFLSEASLLQEHELQTKVSSLQNELTAHKQDTPEFREIQENLLIHQDKLESFIKVLEGTNHLYFQYKYSNYVPSIEDVRKKILKDEKTIVEYFNFGKYVYTLTISPEKATIDRLTLENLRDLTNELNQLCANKSILNQNYSRFAELSHQLYKYLFKPLGITTPKVIISYDDLFIPFEVLLTYPDKPTSFLIKDYVISYAYSSSFLLNFKKSQSTASPNLLGIAPEEFHPSLSKSSLSGAGVSLNKIKTYFKDYEFLIKEAATKEHFLLKVPQYSIVQVYSHAEADTLGNEAFLFFYDSALHLNELQSLSNLRTDLIILSACKTGIGKTVRGEGIFSISRSFAAAGIPSTISNLWEVDNYATYSLTELFYKYINEGYDYDEALQKAKVQLIETSDKEQQLPYYWAASILVGRSNGLKVKESFNFLYWLAGGIICVILMSLFVWRTKRF